MSSISKLRRLTSVTMLALAFGAFASAASAQTFKTKNRTPPPPVAGSFKATGGGGSTMGHVETCNNIASCNLLIAYCTGHGGTWTETGTPGPQGQPQKGKCTYS